MYGMTNYRKLFTDELKDWLIETDFIKYQFKVSIFYKYAPDGIRIVVIYYVDDCVFW